MEYLPNEFSSLLNQVYIIFFEINTELSGLTNLRRNNLFAEYLSN